MKYNLKSLIGLALQEWGSDQSWKAISELQMRGAPETLALVQRLAKSRNYRKRALGMYVASQLCKRQKGGRVGSIEYAVEATQELLLAGLHDTSTEVHRAAISGMGHRPHPLAVPQLVNFASHPEQEIRFAVAVALGSYSGAESINTLIRLAKDESDAVRDWATFALGSIHEVDNAEVRDLLWANAHDNDEDVRGEALVGLAVRKDERIIPILLDRLDTNCRVFELNASEEIASPLLLGRLNMIKASVANESDVDRYWYGCLLDAIDTCSEHGHATSHPSQRLHTQPDTP